MNYTKKVIRTAKRTDEFLASSIANHQARLTSAIKDLENRIISDVKKFRTTDAGKLMGPRVNLKLAQKVHSRMGTLFDATYGDAARRVTRGFRPAEKFIKKSFEDLGIAANFTDVDNDILKTLQKSTWNTFNQFGLQAQEQLVDKMYSAVIGGIPFAELTDQFRGVLSGIAAKRGTMERYSSLYAHDATMNFHTEVTMKKAKDAGVSTFVYYGNLMNTSRKFCIDRVGKTYSRKEIESWNGLTWQGKSGPPLTNRGGYNCRHSWVAVLKANVDEDELNDALAMKKKPKAKRKKKVAAAQQTTAQLKAEYNAARRKLKAYTEKGAPGHGLRSWSYAGKYYRESLISGDESYAVAYQLHQEAFEAEIKWFNSLPAKEKVAQRAKVVESLAKRPLSTLEKTKSVATETRSIEYYDKLERTTKATLSSGTQHMSYRLLRELERNGAKVDWEFTREGRAYYRNGTINLFSGNGPTTVSHEFAHAIDDLMSGGGRESLSGHTGLVWENEGIYVGKAERDLVRKEFKENAGKISTYTNGDGDYYTGNWIDNYEGRIYRHSGPDRVSNLVLDTSPVAEVGIGEEFWSMNVQRFANAYRSAETSYLETEASVKRAIAKLDSSLEAAKSAPNPNSALIKSLEERRLKTIEHGNNLLSSSKDQFIRERLSVSPGWQKVHDFYPNTANLIEKMFMETTADTAAVTDPVLEVLTGRRKIEKTALKIVEQPKAEVTMANRAAPKLKSASRLDPETNYVRIKKGWYYKGKKVTGKLAEDLDALRLPPAWNNVVVSADPLTKVQAIGMDSAGRWQYRYSAKHIEEAARKKFMRIKSFGADHEKIMRAVKRGVKSGDTRAILLDLEDRTAIRVGSDKDFKARVKAYGLTTLQKEHVVVKQNKIIFDFIAKEGKKAHYEITDKTLASWMRERLSTLKSGDQVFSDVNASQLNSYLRELAGGKSYSIKDFRTFHGTRIALGELQSYAGKEMTGAEIKKAVKDVSTTVSDFLHNTPTMARNSYIDPMVWDVIGGI